MPTNTSTRYSNYDAFVNEAAPSANNSDDPYLRVRNGTGVSRRAFLHFALPASNLAGATILEAKLRVKLRAAWSGTQTLRASRVTERWNETSITWANQPTVTSNFQADATVANGAAGDTVEIDVTNMIQRIAEGGSWYGVRLNIPATNDMREMHSSNANLQQSRPQLYVRWSIPPGQPHTLIPSEQAISLANPAFDWDGDTPSQTRVQIYQNEDLSGTLWDSGWISNTETWYETSTNGTPPNLADNITRWWRVRIQDDSGALSPWSVITKFFRRSKDTLTITTPSSDGTTLSTTTPRIVYTYSGNSRVQSARRYRVLKDGQEIYDSGWSAVASSNLAFNIPEGVINSPTPTYSVELRVRDNTSDWSRAGLGQTDPAYVEATRTFKFGVSGGVAAVTSLTSTVVNGHVRFNWTRTGTVEFFAVLRKNDAGVFEVVRDMIPASNLLVSGSNYKLEYYGARPGRTDDYQIAAVQVVSDVPTYSASNPTTVVVFKPRGVWLVDATDDSEMFIAEDKVDAMIGESATTYAPLGTRVPIRVVDQVRGYEGSVAGVLVGTTQYGTALQQRRMLETKVSSSSLRLVDRFRNFPVLIGNVTATNADYGMEEAYEVSFDFWQRGGPWPGDET